MWMLKTVGFTVFMENRCFYTWSCLLTLIYTTEEVCVPTEYFLLVSCSLTWNIWVRIWFCSSSLTLFICEVEHTNCTGPESVNNILYVSHLVWMVRMLISVSHNQRRNKDQIKSVHRDLTTSTQLWFWLLKLFSTNDIGPYLDNL